VWYCCESREEQSENKSHCAVSFCCLFLASRELLSGINEFRSCITRINIKPNSSALISIIVSEFQARGTNTNTKNALHHSLVRAAARSLCRQRRRAIRSSQGSYLHSDRARDRMRRKGHSFIPNTVGEFQLIKKYRVVKLYFMYIYRGGHGAASAFSYDDLPLNKWKEDSPSREHSSMLFSVAA